MRFLVLSLVIAACNFPLPEQSTGPDAGDDAAVPDTPVLPPCPDCQLLSIAPAVANTGDTLFLEGSFEEGAVVTFPGGVTASLSLLGAHRATVIVPAEATAGELTVTVGSTTLGPVSFRRISFAAGTTKFTDFDEQTTGARQLPAVAQPRYQGCPVTIGNSVYVIGGQGPVIERATVGSDGRLGAFSDSGVALADVNGGPCLVAGGFVYVVGGVIGVPLDTIQRAPISADGTLGTFELASEVRLAHARYNHAVVLAGNVMYAIGGATAGNPLFLASVEAIRVNPDGSLTSLGDVGEIAAAKESPSAIVIGQSLYVMGGDKNAGGFPALNTIERAMIRDDGTLGAFEAAGTLAVPRHDAMIWRVGNSVFVAGGEGNSGAGTSLESASVDGGVLGAFSLISATAIPRPLQAAGVVVLGNHAYLISGRLGTSTTVVSTICRASIVATGAFAQPVSAPSQLAVPRDRFRTVVLGSQVYAIGGMSNNVAQRTVERAPISTDGSIGTFAVVTATPLVTARAEPGIAVIGQFLYVIGGSQTSSGPFLATVERALILPDGTLGAFAIVPGVTLVNARNSFATAVVGSSVLVIGGFNGASLASVEVATFDVNGALGAFSTSTRALVSPRSAFSVMVTSNSLFAIGGAGAGGSVERATVAVDGTLGAFATQPNSLSESRHSYTLLALGSNLFAIGGFTTTERATIERAAITTDGSLGSWSLVTPSLTGPRWASSGIVAGNAVHLLGGLTGSATTSTATTQELARLE